ncbi:MAG: hypothetical protein EOP22_15495 [Hyphomicrobiales bacterium]|nr:MAG: hypothetical protein EOP22_15495 [Hyphomicrobiales bacterium]
MTDTQPNPPNELTPEARAIIARARKSFMVTMGLLLVGFLAIGGALIYRSANTGGGGAGAGAEYVIASLKIPPGAEVVSAVAADGKVTLTYKSGLMTSVRIFDGKTGEMIREIPVVSE